MIIFDGDYDRIFHDLCEDDRKVQYYLEKLQNGIVRKFRKTMTFPVWYSEQITLPKTNNTYLVYYYAKNADPYDKFNHFWGALLLLNDKKGQRVVIAFRSIVLREVDISLKLQDKQSFELQVYTGHFFSRYRERMNLPADWSVNDVIVNFFGRNGYYFTMLDYDQVVLEKNRHKSNSAYAIEDGITLADSQTMDGFHVVRHNTFLSHADLKQDQDKANPGVRIMRNIVSIHQIDLVKT